MPITTENAIPASDLGPEHIGKDLIYQNHYRRILEVNDRHIYKSVRVWAGPNDSYEIILRANEIVGVEG